VRDYLAVNVATGTPRLTFAEYWREFLILNSLTSAEPFKEQDARGDVVLRRRTPPSEWQPMLLCLAEVEAMMINQAAPTMLSVEQEQAFGAVANAGGVTVDDLVAFNTKRNAAVLAEAKALTAPVANNAHDDDDNSQDWAWEFEFFDQEDNARAIAIMAPQPGEQVPRTQASARHAPPPPYAGAKPVAYLSTVAGDVQPWYAGFTTKADGSYAPYQYPRPLKDKKKNAERIQKIISPFEKCQLNLTKDMLDEFDQLLAPLSKAPIKRATGPPPPPPPPPLKAVAVSACAAPVGVAKRKKRDNDDVLAELFNDNDVRACLSRVLTR